MAPEYLNFAKSKMHPMTHLKRPRDPNQLAKAIIDIATGPESASRESVPESPAATLGRKGGLKGGKSRAASLTPEKRAEIARKAAKARWGE